jgi:Icc-related predicted phosphoesterase
MIRLLIIADDDSLIRNVPHGHADVLISCGDLCDQTIEHVARACHCRTVFGVRGNHDTASPFPKGFTDLHLSVGEFSGVRFGGFRGSWRYKPRGHHLWEQEEVSTLLRQLPAVDVFVAHNSPRGIHERDSDVHQGFDGFRDYIATARPRYFVHGHQHVNEVTQCLDTSVVGVYGAQWLELPDPDLTAGASV